MRVKRKPYGTVRQMVAAQLKSRSDVRRETILRVAAEIFLEEGYAAASMSAIAARLGGSKGTLYNYFPSKTDLFAAVMAAACFAHSEALFAAADDAETVEQGLRGLGRGFLEFVLEDTTLAIHRVVVAEAHRFPELGQAFYESGPALSFNRLAAWLKVRMAAGELKPADPHVAATQFYALCKARLHAMRLWGLIDTPPREEIEAEVELALKTFLAAYGTKTDQG